MNAMSSPSCTPVAACSTTAARTAWPPDTAGVNQVPWLRSTRLQLREFEPADVDELVRMHADPRLRAHLVDDYPLHQAPVARCFVERLAPIYRQHEGLGIWRASCPDGGGFAGWFSLMPMAERPGEVELGARLIPEVWGTGLAIEGAEQLLDHAFDDLGLSQVIGICHPDNRSARAVLAAVGFEADGLARYDYTVALYHHVGMNVWRATRNTPRRTRLRRALSASRT